MGMMNLILSIYDQILSSNGNLCPYEKTQALPQGRGYEFIDVSKFHLGQSCTTRAFKKNLQGDQVYPSPH